VKRVQQTTRDRKASELGATIAAMKEAGCEVTPDYLLGQITIDEAARFLSTTKGELYNLTSRGAIPFKRWGKRGVRFCRLDLIIWRDVSSKPAST
jgi:excisionase family DNA binding protein